ncbi:MAG: pentapeptide repeat-containing protein [Pseudomonadota bacterium]|nr:pentapeptide repeat-containing protein [Pseudomonadota bacterium]
MVEAADTDDKPQAQTSNQDYEARFQQLEHRLLEQEHRFIAVWLNLFHSFRKGHETERTPALKAVLYSLIPGRALLLITGGTMIGLFTLLLMYQANLLLAKQNHYFQQQIYVQSNTERRRMLVDIKEKLYDPEPLSKQAAVEQDLCKRSNSNLGACGPAIAVQPKFNAPIRTESVLAYLDIQRNPLHQPQPAALPTLESVAHTILNALFEPESPPKSQPEPPKDQAECKRIRAADLRNALLQQVNLVGQCLTGVNFTGADLAQADLSFVDLERSELSNTNLQGIHMIGARLSGSNLFDADLSGAELTRAQLNSTNMAGAFLDGAVLNNTNLQKANLREATLTQAHLNEANLRQANLRGADLTGADLIGADLFEANLKGAQFHCDQLKQAKHWQSAELDQPCP